MRLDPEDLNVLNSLGVCYGQQGKRPAAIEVFERVLAKDGDNLMAHYNRGFILAMEGDSEAALESFRRAATIDPANFDVLYHLGRLALELDLVEEAVRHLALAVDLKNSRPIVFRYLGEAWLKSERPGEAMEAYKAAVRYDPEDASSLSQLGVLIMQQGIDLEVALSLVRQSVSLDPTNNLFRARLARVLARTRRTGEALEEYGRVLAAGSATREIHYELAAILKELGRGEEAGEHLKRALEIDPEFQAAKTMLAELEQA